MQSIKPTGGASTDSDDEPTRAGFFAGGELPAPETRARRFAIRVSSILALLAGLAYLVWRAGFTLGHDLWISIPLLGLELYALIGLALFTFSLWDVDRRSPSDPEKVIGTARVAVFIPTYNETREVLLPTIAAAVAVEPAHETWVLDDGHRPWVKELATLLGAHYLTREDRLHAKAGNLNHALSVVEADYVAVLDADHVARPGLLTHVLGYFADPKVAVVQTPQDFYNLESFEHARNRSWFWPEARRLAYNEQRVFYRSIQPGKNRWGAAFWCGTGAVLRVAALRDVGGVATESLTEDMHTTIRLHRAGWRTVYHNEVLAYGLAARNAAEYQSQRIRWGTGAMQILRLEHPLTTHGLTFTQRLAYASTLLGWFDAWRALGYVLLPLVVLFTGANPITAPTTTFLLAFGGTFLAQRLSLALLARGNAPQGMSILFEFVRMQSNLRATLRLLSRRKLAFGVTTKDGTAIRHRIRPPWLLLTMVVASGLAFAWFFLTLTGHTPLTYHVRWTVYGAAGWGVFNLALMIAAIQRVHADRFATERRGSTRVHVGVPLYLDGITGTLVDVSVGGALVRCASAIPPRNGHHWLDIDLGRSQISLSVDVRGEQQLGDGGALAMLCFAPDQEREIARLSTWLFGGQIEELPRARALEEPAA